MLRLLSPSELRSRNHKAERRWRCCEGCCTALTEGLWRLQRAKRRMSAMSPLNPTGTGPGRMQISTLHCHIITYKGTSVWVSVVSFCRGQSDPCREAVHLQVTHRCPRTHGCPAAQRYTWRMCWLVAAAPRRRWWENTKWRLQGDTQKVTEIKHIYLKMFLDVR